MLNILDIITDWIKGILRDCIMGNLDGMFDQINSEVGEVAANVGTTPAAWNAGVFSMIRNLSDNVVVPIAGMIITFVLCYPEQIDSNVHSVSAGVNHMLYLKNDGTMWGCGGPEHAGEGGSRLGRGDVWGEDLTPYGFGFTAYQWHVTQCGLSYGTFAGQFGPIQEEVELVAGFSDIAANAYYRDAVEWAVDEGITTGTGDTTFSPDQDCTRAQIITFLWRAAGSPQTSTIAVIEDIDPSQFYFDAVTWAAEQGIVEDGEDFRPNDPCTRAMAVEFMWRAAGFQAISMDTGFTDVSASASYSTAIEWAVNYGITTGTSDTTFSPDTVCSRGQIVTFLYRASSENLL